MFKADNLFFRSVNKVFDVVAVSILWVICCIPIITIGAATTALYRTVYKNIRQNRGYCYKGFFECFRENFKNTVPLSIIFFALTVINLWDIVVSYNYLNKVSSFAGFQLVFLGFWILIMTWAIWTFALTARFENSWKNTMKNGGLMFFAHLPVTFGIAVVFGVSVFLVYYIPILIMVVPVGAMLLNSLMLEKVFIKYIENEDEKE